MSYRYLSLGTGFDPRVGPPKAHSAKPLRRDVLRRHSERDGQPIALPRSNHAADRRAVLLHAKPQAAGWLLRKILETPLDRLPNAVETGARQCGLTRAGPSRARQGEFGCQAVAELRQQTGGK